MKIARVIYKVYYVVVLQIPFAMFGDKKRSYPTGSSSIFLLTQ